MCDFDGGIDHFQKCHEPCSPPNDSGFAHSSQPLPALCTIKELELLKL